MLNYLHFKNRDKGEKGNYRPVSILPNFLKVFERLIFNQVNEFMERKNFQISHWLFKKPQYTIPTTKNDRKLENTVK